MNRHYSDFDLRSARLVTLTEDQYQYVSYRIKNQVFWTRHKLRIPKGEVLITDGKNLARTRCGNRLCRTAQNLAAPKEPTERMLSLDFDPKLLASNALPLAQAPPIGELQQEYPSLPFDMLSLKPLERNTLVPSETKVTDEWPTLETFSPVSPGVSGTPSNVPQIFPPFTPTSPEIPVNETPEPATFWLLGLSLMGAFGVLAEVKRRAAKTHLQAL